MLKDGWRNMKEKLKLPKERGRSSSEKGQGDSGKALTSTLMNVCVFKYCKLILSYKLLDVLQRFTDYN